MNDLEVLLHIKIKLVNHFKVNTHSNKGEREVCRSIKLVFHR